MNGVTSTPRQELDAPLEHPLITTWGLVVEGCARVNQRFEADLERELGLPAKWFEVLLRLGRTPGQRLPLTELATSVSFSSSGFTRLADRLERAVAVHLEGLRRYVAAPLTPTQLAQLAEIMRTLRDAATSPSGLEA